MKCSEDDCGGYLANDIYYSPGLYFRLTERVFVLSSHQSSVFVVSRIDLHCVLFLASSTACANDNPVHDVALSLHDRPIFGFTL